MRLLAERFEKKWEFLKGPLFRCCQQVCLFWATDFDNSCKLSIYFGPLISTTAGGQSVAAPERTCSHVAWGGMVAAGDLLRVSSW